MLVAEWEPRPCPWCEGGYGGCKLCRGTGWLHVRPTPPRRTREDEETRELPAVTEKDEATAVPACTARVHMPYSDHASELR